MANKKVIGFSIDIEGIDSLDRLKEEIKATKQELGALEKGTDEYNNTARKLAKLQAEQKAVRKEQTELTKSFLETRQATKPYDALSAQLNRLRKDYKNLAAAGKGQTSQAQELLGQIDRLDTKLKDIDASVGQYQRNVGNYAGGFKEALGEFTGGLGDLGALLNPATIGVGAAIAGAQALSREVLAIEQEFAQLGKTASTVTGLTGQALDEIIVNTQALGQTFGQETDALIMAQNTLIKEFGVSVDEAFNIVQTGLNSSANAGGDFLDSVREYSTQIREAGGSAEQLVSILAKSGREGVVSDKGIDAVKEFGLIIRSESTAAKDALSAAFGQGFADEIIKGVRTGSVTTLDALQKVSGKINEISDQTKKQELVSNLFGGAGEDAGTRFLATLSDIDSELGQIVDSTNPYVKAQQDLLAANKELAEAQKAVAAEFQGANSGIATLTARFKAFSIQVLLASFKAIVAALQPVTDLFKSIGQQVVDFAQRFGLVGTASKRLGGTLQGFFNSMMKYLLTPLRTAAVLIQGAVDIFFALAGAVMDFIKLLPGAGAGLQLLIDLYFDFIDAFTQLPAVVSGIVEVIKQLGREFIRFFELAILDAQIFAAKAKSIFSDAAAAQVAELRKQRAAVADEAVSIAQAFSKGFNAQIKKDQEAEAATQKKAAVEAEKAKQAAVAKARQAALQASKKEREEAQKFAKEDADFYKQQADILNKIQKRNEDIRIEQLQDAQLQERTLAQQASAERIAAAKEELAQLQEVQAQQEAATAARFGANSQQLAQLQEANAQAQQEAATAVANTILREQQELTDKLLEIDESYSKASIAIKDKAAQAELKKLDMQAKLQLLEVDRLLANEVLSEEDAAKQKLAIQEQLLKDKLALFQQELEAKQKLADAGVDVDQSAIDQLRLQIAETRTQIAQLGKAGSEDQAAGTAESIEAVVASYADAAKQASGILSDFFNAGQERLRNQVQEQQEANALERQQLEEQLQGATGLEARYLQQRIEANTAAAAQIAKEQEKIERRQAIADKARAITESIINTAVNVTKVLANPIQAVAVGAAGIAQTALIAAQKFATGGKVGKGNIPRQPNGDNVLATLKTDEVVLTRGQQAALGGAPAMAAAGVPGFASGGLVGSAIPGNVVTSGGSTGPTNLIKQMIALTEATNKRMDRLQVVYTAETQEAQDRAQLDKKQIKQDASF